MFTFCSHGQDSWGSLIWKLGWRIHAKCLVIGPKPKSRDRTAIYCDTIAELDMKTPGVTRGEDKPLGALHERLK